MYSSMLCVLSWEVLCVWVSCFSWAGEEEDFICQPFKAKARQKKVLGLQWMVSSLQKVAMSSMLADMAITAALSLVWWDRVADHSQGRMFLKMKGDFQCLLSKSCLIICSPVWRTENHICTWLINLPKGSNNVTWIRMYFAIRTLHKDKKTPVQHKLRPQDSFSICHGFHWLPCTMGLVQCGVHIFSVAWICFLEFNVCFLPVL